ncbi:MAG: hypothetical protein M1840_001513 [Geoglossum simile]|nr:MAG: hypothetical protein M1840_001513 [Geoglossum simile]
MDLSRLATKVSQLSHLPPLDQREKLARGFTICTYLILSTILSLPTRQFRTLLFLAFTLTAAIALPSRTTRSPAHDYWFGILFAGSVIRGVDYIILTNAEKDFYHVDGNGAPEKTPWRRGTPSWSPAKWLWAASIWLNNRGVNWSWEVKNIRPKPAAGYPIWKFILNMLFRTFAVALLVDFTGNGYLSAFGRPSSFYGEPLWPNQCLLAWISFAHMAFHLDMSYSLSAVVLTLVGFYSPRDWPPLFGLVTDSWTVRRFWG